MEKKNSYLSEGILEYETFEKDSFREDLYNSFLLFIKNCHLKYGDKSIQAFDEKTWGTLAPGFNADFVVLPNNPFEIDPHAVSDMHVLFTYRNGEAIYSAQ